MLSRCLAAGLGLALLLAGAGCGARVGSSNDQGYISGDGVITRLPQAQRERPGQVAGQTLEGRDVSLASYAGEVVVVNVWGSWCAACRAESADLSAAARALAPQGVVFLGINTRDASRDTALAFQRGQDVPYSSIFDPTGRTLLAFRGTITPSAVPSTVIIDRQGRVAASIIGEVTSRQTLIDLAEDVAR